MYHLQIEKEQIPNIKLLRGEKLNQSMARRSKKMALYDYILSKIQQISVWSIMAGATKGATWFVKMVASRALGISIYLPFVPQF